MEQKTVTMSATEYKRFLAFKQADKIVHSMKRGLREVNKARKGEYTLKSAYQLANEL